ncbi:metal-dependent hydrolase [bacterium]|nr:metal-dependent hydrolase [bacterium]
MASYQSHINVSAITGLLYAIIGVVLIKASAELALLAAGLIVVTGMLPDIDGGEKSPAHEFGCFLGALVPFILFQFHPEIFNGSAIRLASILLGSYLISRIFVVRILKAFTIRRGLFHSVPAALIATELTYLVFFDANHRERLYLAVATMLGFMSHLMLDATSNVDLIGNAFGGAEPKPRALKFRGNSSLATVAVYAVLILCTYLVLQDLTVGNKIVAKN